MHNHRILFCYSYNLFMSTVLWTKYWFLYNVVKYSMKFLTRFDEKYFD